jgi:nucleoside-diphosphate-sugar epimerase
MKKVLVCGAGGFIGSHLVTSLKQQGNYVIGADLKLPEFGTSDADKFEIVDLRNQKAVLNLVTSNIDTIYQLAANMGGAGYIFTGDNDADVMHDSSMINLNVLNAMQQSKVKNIFFTSSACIYPHHNQHDINNILTTEESAYPANPDSEYGWEKLYAERLYLSFARNYGFRTRIARLHNVFGPKGSWNNGKEKAPAAICRKVAESQDGIVEVWGTGTQTRSFLYIDQCIEGIHRIQNSDCSLPLNLGSEQMISINDLVKIVASIAGKEISTRSIKGPVGVTGRTSDNNLIKQLLNWSPIENFEQGLTETYQWIYQQISKKETV